MSRVGLTCLVLLGALSLASCKTNEELSERRCNQAGVKEGTPEFDQCVRDELVWRQQNRAIQNRIYTQ